MGQDSAVIGKRHTHAERGHDLYETPAVATESLLRVERLPHRIWEPAAGRGAMVRVLRAAGHEVYATDLIDYGSADVDLPGADFFRFEEMPAGCEAIITNPPFMHANEFVARAIEIAPLVVVLLRLAFLESERRTPILDSGHLARVHVYRKRLPMLHRDGWEGRKANSGMAFGWFIFSRYHAGPAQLHRISWDR